MISGQPAATGQSVATCELPQLVPATVQGRDERGPGEDEEGLSREELFMRALDQQLDGGGRRRRRHGGKQERQRRREAHKMRQIWFESKALLLKERLLQRQGISAGTVVDRRMVLSSFRLLDIDQKYVIPRERFFTVLRNDLEMQWGAIEMSRFWRMLCGGNRPKLSFQAFSLVFKADHRNVAANQRLFLELGTRLTQKQAPRTTMATASRFEGDAQDARGVGGQSPSMGKGSAYSFGRKSHRASRQDGPDFIGQGGLDEGPSYSIGRGSIRPTPPRVPKLSQGHHGRSPPTKPEVLEEETASEEEEEEEEEEEKEPELSPEDLLRLRAAVRLQAFWRGCWCRELLWRKRATPHAIRVQAAYRRRIARRFAEVLKLMSSYQHKVVRKSEASRLRRAHSKRRSAARTSHVQEPIARSLSKRGSQEAIARSLSKRRSSAHLEFEMEPTAPVSPNPHTARAFSKRRSSARMELGLEPVTPAAPSGHAARSPSKRRSSACTEFDPEPMAPISARSASKRISAAEHEV